MAASELKQRTESVQDAPVRKLAAPERAHRYNEQVAKLPGLSLTGELDVADSCLSAPRTSRTSQLH